MSLPSAPILLARLALRPRPSFRPHLRPTLLPAPSPKTDILPQARHASILSGISDNAGAYKKKIRRGRGPASGKGKTSGRGHKGQGQHGKGPPVGFQGGQTPEHIVKGPRGFENIFSKDMTTLNLDRLQSWVDQGRINPSRPITLVQLYESGCVNSVGDGIKLLARGRDVLRTPVHIVVSQASREAIAAIERAGGSITTRYYTKPAIANILAGRTHPVHSRLFQPTPVTDLAAERGAAEFEYELPDPAKRKVLEYYRDVAHRGYLSYQVPLGHSPSLYFKTPGTVVRSSKREKEENLVENRLW